MVRLKENVYKAVDYNGYDAPENDSSPNFARFSSNHRLATLRAESSIAFGCIVPAICNLGVYSDSTRRTKAAVPVILSDRPR